MNNERTEFHDFGIRDPWGRDIGAMARTWTLEEVSFPFGLYTQATRDRLPYGASQHEQRFETEAARSKAILRYLNGAQKRAVKIAARGTLFERRERRGQK